MIIKINSYLFIDYLYENVEKKIKRFKNLSIIYSPANDELVNHDQVKNLTSYCKKNKIKFFFKDSLKLATKYKTEGIFITTSYRRPFKNLNNKNIRIIGSAHNQKEYFLKINQGCNLIMLSPLFFNKKYSKYKILGINRFNLISKNWNCEICALGGILKENLKKISMTKSKSIGFIRLFNELK